MSHVPHELHAEFPDLADKIHALKVGNAHFSKLSDQYHEINREIHRIESGVAPTSDNVLEDLKKSRLHLVDEIAAMLRA